MRVHVTKWGNSLGVRVPKPLAHRIGLSEGAVVDIEADDHRLVVTPVKQKYTLADLLADTTPEEYGEYAVEWGPDVGREIVD